MDWESKIPADVSDSPHLNHGISGAIFALEGNMIAKQPYSPNQLKEQEIEWRVLQRLGDHPRIVKALGRIEQPPRRRCIVFERMPYVLLLRLEDLKRTGERLRPEQILKWAKHAAEGIQYIHSRNVRQVDIGISNMLLDEDDNLRLCDFAGVSIDNDDSTICPSSYNSYPWAEIDIDLPTDESDMYTLGGVFYEMLTFHKPYSYLHGREAEALNKAKIFPPTDDLLLGNVIQNCWHCRYQNAGEIVADIEELERQYLEAKQHSRPFRSTYGPSIDPESILSISTAFFIVTAVLAISFHSRR